MEDGGELVAYGRALIDTGASISAVQDTVATKLNLEPVRQEELGGSAGRN